MEKAALLARVSGASQEDNSSPNAQLKREREYCQRKGYSVLTERIEVMSGAFVLARSVYNELLAMAADGQISVIVADIPDRLGRGDAIAKLELLAQMNGARVEYAQPGRDTSTVEGLIQHSAEQMVSGIERMNIRRRTMGGKRDWATRGRIIASPNRPYGYRFVSTYDTHGHKVSCELAIVEEEARVIRMAYEWLAYDHLTLYGVVQKLNKLQIPTRNMNDHPEDHLEVQWDRPVVYRMLTSTTYKGEWRYAKRNVKRIDTPDGIRLTRTWRDESETVAVQCPGIVSEELWQKAQTQLEANKAKFRKPTVNQYLLRGRVKCARCESNLAGAGRSHSTGIYRWYRCGRTSKAAAKSRCKAKFVKAEALEYATWAIVCQEIQNIDILICKAKEEQSKDSDTRRVIEQQIAAAEVQCQKASERYGRYERLYGDGDLSQSKLAEYRKECDAETDKRRKEIADWQAILTAQPTIAPDFETRLRKLASDLADRLTPDTPYEEKLQLIDMLNVKCIYDDRIDHLTITGMFGEHQLSRISTCAYSNAPSQSSKWFAGG